MLHSKTFHLECYFLLHGTIRRVESQIQCFDFIKTKLQWSWSNVFQKKKKHNSFMDKLIFVFIFIQKRKIQCWHFIQNRHAKFQPAVIYSSCGNRFQRFINRFQPLLQMTTTITTPQKNTHKMVKICRWTKHSENASVKEQIGLSFSES